MQLYGSGSSGKLPDPAKRSGYDRIRNLAIMYEHQADNEVGR
jgi:hypothetical protein